jgi:hypothetical protein
LQYAVVVLVVVCVCVHACERAYPKANTTIHSEGREITANIIEKCSERKGRDGCYYH